MSDVSISVTTQAIVAAPAPVWVQAEPTGYSFDTTAGHGYDPADHEITYVWRIEKSDGQGGWIADALSPFTAPQNMVPQWNEPNRSYGRRAVFCLTSPGDWRITVEAYKWGVPVRSHSVTQTVISADAAYPGAQTIYYDPAGVYEDAPAGCVRTTNGGGVRNFAAQGGAARRVLLARGHSYDFYTDIKGGQRLSHVEPRGTGTRPLCYSTVGAYVFSWRSNGGTVNADDHITLSGISFDSGWNAMTETDDRTKRGSIQFLGMENHPRMLLHDCRFDGGDLVLANNVDLCVADCVFPQAGNYGLYSDRNYQGKIALTGCRLMQPVQAPEGGGGKGEVLYNEHTGGFRFEDCTWVVVDVCDFYGRGGWGASPAAQNPLLRINTSGVPGLNLHVGRSVLEGGFTIIQSAGESGGPSVNPGNYVYDKLLLLGTARTFGPMIDSAMSGSTFRNILGWMPDVPTPYGDLGPRCLIQLNGRTSDPDKQGQPIRVYNCTMLSQLSAARDGGRVAGLIEMANQPFTDVEIENNIEHAPSASAPLTASGPIDLAATVPGISPRYPGTRYNFAPIRGTLAADVPIGGSFTIPYPDKLDMAGDGPAGLTDQSYWLSSRDQNDTNHRLRKGKLYWTDDGQMAVAFNPGDITITNTSGDVWGAGSYILRLDRGSMLDIDLPVNQTYASPSAIPLPRPVDDPGGQGVSPAITKAPRGDTLMAYDDFFGTPRDPNALIRGALPPA